VTGKEETMTKMLKSQLRRTFNMFGPSFEAWLTRMFPLRAAANTVRVTRDGRFITLDEGQRVQLERLIEQWLLLNEDFAHS
jgi:hypothetical protein